MGISINQLDITIMERYDYFAAVKDYINENNIVVTSENAWTAEEYLCHNWDLLGEALTDFGCDMNYLGRGAEACDVTIRCYLLGQAISEVLNEVKTEEEE